MKNVQMKKAINKLSAALLGVSLVFVTPTVSGAASQWTTTDWTREQAGQIQLSDSNTAPVINPDELQEISPDYILWDTWPLQNKNGIPASVNGYKIIFALTVPKGTIPGKRHDSAQIRYFYSKDGKSWTLGGLLFNDGKALGSRQWAGSSIIDKDGKIHIFYTATGTKNEQVLSYSQRLVTAAADIQTTNDSVTFANWSDHKVILEADGTYYQNGEQAAQGESSYAFRDPYYFQDPKTNEEYILFSANTAGTLAERSCGQEQAVPPGSTAYNASIGIAKAVNGDLTEFKALPPVLAANCVNDELERPSVMVKGNQYYLFAKTHSNKFAPGLNAPEGLYGFVSGTLSGAYKPLNGSGLVIGNPNEAPYQAYSWMVMSNGTVISYIDYTDVDGKSIQEIGEQSPEYQIEHFGGKLAPSIKLSIAGDQTSVLHEKHQGVLR
jgi:levansucrase